MRPIPHLEQRPDDRSGSLRQRLRPRPRPARDGQAGSGARTSPAHAGREGDRGAPQPARRHLRARGQSRRRRRSRISAPRAWIRPKSTCSTGGTTWCSFARSSPRQRSSPRPSSAIRSRAGSTSPSASLRSSRGQYEDAVNVVLPGGGSRAVGSASLPVSRRDVRRRPRARRRDYEAARALRESAARERAGPLPSGDDALERAACRLAAGRSAPRGSAAQTSGRARSEAREGLHGARDPALGSAAVQGSDSGPASPRHAWSRGWRRRTTGWRRRTSARARPSWP